MRMGVIGGSTQLLVFASIYRMPPRKKKSKITFEAIESDLRSMDCNSLVDIIKDCCENGHEEVIMPVIGVHLQKKKESGEKNASFFLEYKVKGHITDWDDGTFTDCYGDEVNEAASIEEEAIQVFDCKDRKKGAIYRDVNKANIDAEKEMKKQIKRIQKNEESDGLTLLSKHEELGPSSKEPDVSPISKSLVNGRVMLKATVKFVVDGVGADLRNRGDVDITVSVVEV